MSLLFLEKQTLMLKLVAIEDKLCASTAFPYGKLLKKVAAQLFKLHTSIF